MSSLQKEDQIREHFPLLEKIEDTELRQAVISCWMRVWEESAWEDLTDCPFTPPFPDMTLVDHINCVGELVLSSVGVMKKKYPELSFDQDYLLTGVMLHDLSKLLEIEPAEDGFTWGSLTKMMPHATYGAFVAMAQGLSPKVANIILAHSRMTGALPASPEAVLLHYTDYGLADVLRSSRGLNLIMDGGPKLGK
jgi:hypothetical protein